MKALTHINLLGQKVRCKTTGISGVVTSVSFDLYGCIQAVVQPPANADNTVPAGVWCDVNRLEISGGRVMNTPNFDHQIIADGDHGPAAKPIVLR